jgi:outer membrane protein OmpA-like peptidoglycan-associated protein
MKTRLLVGAVAGLSLILAGCEATNTQKGAAIGAIIGAVAGKATGDHDKKRYAWGALVGAIAGGAIGSYMDKQEAAFRDELADSGVKVHREGDNIRLEMPSDITFTSGNASLANQFKPVLDDVALVLNRYEKTFLQIDGHTDSQGGDQFNQSLSESRASAVRNYLLERQVNGRRMVTQGYGETQPVASNASANGRSQNRRVELMIIPNS